MKVTKLLHTRMRVSDMEQTIAFYTGVLGLEVLERKTSPRGSHLAFLQVPNSDELIELTSFPPSGPVKVQEDLVHLAFQVESLDATIASLTAKGVKITRLGWKFYDPDIIEKTDPRNAAYYWIGTGTPRRVGDAGTDVMATHDGYITLTPLHTDMTAHHALRSAPMRRIAKAMAR